MLLLPCDATLLGFIKPSLPHIGHLSNDLYNKKCSTSFWCHRHSATLRSILISRQQTNDGTEQHHSTSHKRTTKSRARAASDKQWQQKQRTASSQKTNLDDGERAANGLGRRQCPFLVNQLSPSRSFCFGSTHLDDDGALPFGNCFISPVDCCPLAARASVATTSKSRNPSS